MKRIGVLTSGGDSPGMNAAIRAVVRTAHYHGVEVMGIMRGYHGMIHDQFIEMGPRSVSGIINKGGTILHSARSKEFREMAGMELAVKNLEKHGIEGFIAIGGDGSYRGAKDLHDHFGIKCIGMPGTIDNDIGGTDFTIGFDTAVTIALDAIDRIRDTAESHERIFFIEVMGRHSGYIAMQSGIAGGAEEILVPEIKTNLQQIVANLRKNQKKGKQTGIVVVAEGDEEGSAMTIQQKIADMSEFKDTRLVVIGHMQRGGSPTAYDRYLASRLGVRAVEALLEGESGKMAGVSALNVVLRPLEEAWMCRTRFKPELTRVAHILAS